MDDQTAVAGPPRLLPDPLDEAGEFVASAGLVLDECSPPAGSVGHIDLDSRHHTPWGIVHGGVYATAIESAASIGATAAVGTPGRWRWG